MFFSIIIPTYNNIKLLKCALDSCKKQSFKDFEVIVVDDSSNDDIETYMAKTSIPWLSYYRNRPALGAAKNWNYGLTLAEGDHIMLLHHDESMQSEHFLTSLFKAFRPQIDVVVSNIYVEGRRQRRLLHHVLTPWLLHFPSTLFFCNFIGPCACLCFRKKQLRFFNETLRWAIDYEWYYRMLQNRRVVYLRNNYIYSHHGHKDQITNTIDIQKTALEDNKILRKEYLSNGHIRAFIWLGTSLRRLLKTVRQK